MSFPTPTRLPPPAPILPPAYIYKEKPMREYRRCVPAKVEIRNVPLIPGQSHFPIFFLALCFATTEFAPLMAEASDFPDFSIEFATSDHCLCSIPELAFLVWPLAALLVHGISSLHPCRVIC